MPQGASQGVGRQHELERGDATTGLHDPGQFAERGAWILDVADQVGEREVVEIAVAEGQGLGFAANQRDVLRQPGVRIELCPSPGEHLGALVKTDHRAVVAAHERSGHHARASGNVEDAVARGGTDLAHHRTTPAGVLAEAEESAG